MAFRARSIRVGPRSSAGIRQIGSSSSSSSGRLSSARRASVLSTLSVSSESGVSTQRRQCPHWSLFSRALVKQRLCTNFPQHGMGRHRLRDWISKSSRQMKHRSPNARCSGANPCKRRLCLEVIVIDCGWVVCVFIFGVSGSRDIFFLSRVQRGDGGASPLS